MQYVLKSSINSTQNSLLLRLQLYNLHDLTNSSFHAIKITSIRNTNYDKIPFAYLIMHPPTVVKRNIRKIIKRSFTIVTMNPCIIYFMLKLLFILFQFFLLFLLCLGIMCSIHKYNRRNVSWEAGFEWVVGCKAHLELQIFRNVIKI